MTKVAFDIEFTVDNQTELIGKASISRTEAQKIEKLLDDMATVISFNFSIDNDLVLNHKAHKNKSKSKKKEEPPKQVEKSVKVSEDEDDIQDIDEGEVLKILPNIRYNEDFENYYESGEDNENILVDEQEEEIDHIMMSYENKRRTKRQRGELLELEVELPSKRSRKKQYDHIKKIERDERRKIQMRKHAEKQRMETLNQILNETGRKQRLRNQKQTKEKMNRENRVYKTLGDTPKIITHQSKDDPYLVLFETELFTPEMLQEPVIRVKKDCYLCGSKGKYRTQEGDSMVCSLPCYKQHQSQQQTKMEVEQ